MIPQTSNFPQQYKGNTFKGRQLTITKEVGGVESPIGLKGATITMQFRRTIGGVVEKNFNVGNGITITDAPNGVFQIDSFLVDLSQGKYLYDLTITFPDGLIRTYMTGSFEVKQNLA